MDGALAVEVEIEVALMFLLILESGSESLSKLEWELAVFVAIGRASLAHVFTWLIMAYLRQELGLLAQEAIELPLLDRRSIATTLNLGRLELLKELL